MTVEAPDLPQVSPMNRSRPLTPYISPWLSWLIYYVGQFLLLPLYFKTIEVEGWEKVPQNGAVIFAPMHRSRWDAFMVPYIGGRFATGRDLHFMVTVDEIKGLQGWIIRRMGCFPVDTRHPSLESIRCGVNLLQSARAMVVFPEGNIFKDGQIHPLKVGLARMALQASKGKSEPGKSEQRKAEPCQSEQDKPGNVTIVPIGLYYDKPNVPWGTSVKIKIGDPLQTQAYGALSTKEGSKQLTADLTRSLQDLQDQFPSV